MYPIIEAAARDFQIAKKRRRQSKHRHISGAKMESVLPLSLWPEYLDEERLMTNKQNP